MFWTVGNGSGEGEWFGVAKWKFLKDKQTLWVVSPFRVRSISTATKQIKIRGEGGGSWKLNDFVQTRLSICAFTNCQRKLFTPISSRVLNLVSMSHLVNIENTKHETFLRNKDNTMVWWHVNIKVMYAMQMTHFLSHYRYFNVCL